jgi:hypothetical protein
MQLLEQNVQPIDKKNFNDEECIVYIEPNKDTLNKTGHLGGGVDDELDDTDITIIAGKIIV